MYTVSTPVSKNNMTIQVINDTWHTKPVTIKDKTTRVLSNGKRIPTQLAMHRRVSKI